MFKALLKSRLLAYAMWFTGGSRTKKRSKGRSIGFALLMLYAFGCLAFLFGMYFSELAGPFSAAGIGWFYFALMGLAAFAVMFIFSAFMAKAQLFEAKDNELLLSMPIPPRLILASRMVSLLVYNLIFGLLVIVPALVVWLRVAPLPVMGVIAFLLVALGLPLLACACSSLLGWLLALITARVRRKSLVTTVFSLLFLAAYFYGYNKLMAVVQQLAVTGVQTAAQWRSAAPLYWLGDAIANGSVLHLLLTVLLCLAVFAVVYAVLSAFFLRITTTKHALAKIEYREKSLKVSGARQALLRREWKRLLSSSVYLLNAGLTVVFLLAGAVALVIFRKDVCAMLLEMGANGNTSALLAAAAAVFLCCMLLFTAPSVSLEGRSLWIVRSAPVTGWEVLQAKLRLHFTATFPPMTLFLLVCLWVFRPTFVYGILMFVLPLLFAWFMGNLGLIENLRRPNFDWTDESRPIKQDMPVMLTMLIGVLAAGAPAALYFALLYRYLAPLPYVSICTLLVLAATVATYRWLKTRGAAIFNAL